MTTKYEAITEYDAVERLRHDLVAELSAKTRRLQELGLAQSLIANPDDFANERTASARAKVRPETLDLARRRPDKVRQESLDLLDGIENLRERLVPVTEQWLHVRSVRTSQIAISKQARQRKIAMRMANLLSQMSEQVAAERELHAELAKDAPNPTSVYLQDITREIAPVADLTNARSLGSAWLHRMKQMEVLPK